ncbi:phage neck terminator protein [Enterobacter sp.]|uniref:phage neck terminator protein n=1 Tax=Enterobacter sp. TaxID=42895 RepID=UPI003D113951
MSNNTSTEHGWLTPTSGDPDYDEALDRLLSRWMRNVSGLPPAMVRPRWQKEQPSLPSVETNWCAIGVIGCTTDNNPAFTHQTEENVQLWRHETFECMASFYGPDGMSFASRFRDGIAVPQNNSELNLFGLTLGDYTGLTPFPELINQQWVRRYDMTVRLRRKVIREYNIKAIVDVENTVTISTGD